ncbi:MAG: hypothetical protein AB7O98_02755 [Hyphomonadaceae bacterium]
MKALKWAAAAVVLILAACGQADAPTGAPTTEATATPTPEGQAPVVLATTRNMPDWLLVARQRDCPRPTDGSPDLCIGEVHFNQRTITRGADGMADIWVQVRHAQPQLYDIESETHRTTIRYQLQRLHYRFNCESQEFIVIERQIMGPNERVVTRDYPRQIWRAPAQGSATHIVMPIACRGG